MSKISASNQGDRITLSIDGNLAFDLNREFRDAYKQIPPHTRVTIDLSRTSYVDSAGLGMLIQLREHVGADKASVTLVGANETIRTILDVANFGRLFSIT